MTTDRTRWHLLDDITGGVADEIPGAVGRSLMGDSSRPAKNDHFFALGPADDRSTWHLVGEGARPDCSEGWIRFSDVTISSARRSLTLILTILHAENRGCRGWRWRLAARVSEVCYPIVVHRASSGDAESSRLLPLHAWVRWRLLSEPFRGGVASSLGSSCDTKKSSRGTERRRDLGDPDGPSAYARGTFGGFHSLRRRARESRTVWAELLLRHQDLPKLGSIDPECEAKLLIFCETRARNLLSIEDRAESAHSPDSTFVTWFTREFFSRRFMVGEVWRAVRSRWKWLSAGLAVVTVLSAVAAVWAIPPDSAVACPCTDGAGARLVVGVVFLMGLVGVASSIVAGLIWTRDGERYTYPFFLRFGAGTILGSAAVIALRASWIEGLVEPSRGSEWRPWVIVAGMVVAGLGYLLVEARLHSTPPSDTIYRAVVVWLIGLAWAVTIAAIDVLVIAPIFTEDYLRFARADARMVVFSVTALASLDLGIFLQVLWEDRPVTYPLGALRFSKHE